MEFTYYFDIAAIFLLVVIFLTFRRQPLMKNATHYFFLAIIFLGIFTAIADILSVIGVQKANMPLLTISNTFYYLGEQWITFTFFLFAMSPLARMERIKIWKKYTMLFPIVGISIVILLNPVFHWLYKYNVETGEYTYGVLQFLCYVPIVIYYFHSVYYVHARKDVYNEHMRYAILNTVVIIVAGIIFQLIFPHILFHLFAISISLIQIFMIMLQQGIAFDPRTMMMNRNSFYTKTTILLYNKIPFTAISIRLADYEAILSTYGIELLEELEQMICRELYKIIPRNSGYKINDDIYSVIYENIDSEEVAAIQMELERLLGQKWTVKGIDISFSYFIVAFDSGSHFKSNEELISLMILLHRTKRMRYGILSMDEFVIRDMHRESEIEKAMIQALYDRSFEIYYQPICTGDQRFVTSEALIRLNHSIIGPIYPNEFIPIAERTGIIIPLGEYILEEVCKFIQTHDLNAMGIEYIEVNLSTVQCLQRNFIPMVTAMVKKYDVKPSQICFEITETASNCSPEIFSQNLAFLHDAGYKLAIDDFGTGYGNLQRLISMEFDFVKFDRETTNQICTDPKIRPIFSKMIQMIHFMNAKVVSEGVETKEQFEFLRSIDVDYMQGFYFSQAISEADYVKYVEEHLNK